MVILNVLQVIDRQPGRQAGRPLDILKTSEGRTRGKEGEGKGRGGERGREQNRKR